MHISAHILGQLSLQRRYADFLGITHFKILLSMLHIDLNTNELHIIQSWENWKNTVLLDLTTDSCFPPSLNPLRAVTRTKTLWLPCLLFCYWFISRTNLVHMETEWMVSVYMGTLSQTACMMKQLPHDCGVRALRSGTCKVARGDRGAVAVNAG